MNDKIIQNVELTSHSLAQLQLKSVTNQKKNSDSHAVGTWTKTEK